MSATTNSISTTAQTFAARADELARWTWENLVNRIDVWGGYLPLGVRKPGKSANVTKPAIKDRGRRQLTLAMVKAHFAGADQSHIIGLHAIAPDNTCKWFGIEVDAHGDIRPDNWPATSKIIERLEGFGLFALVTDSNGRGGFHILIVLDSPLPSDMVHRFAQSVIDDWQEIGLSGRPETFPKQPSLNEVKPFGNWLRLPGRHHTREHWSRVWGGDGWYDGEDAVDLILKCSVNSSEIVAKLAPAETKAPRPKPINGNGHHVDDTDKVKRAAAYIDKIPGAISGQRGHDQTLTVACELFRFGLSESDALALLSDYNRRCQPEWSEAELRHKLTDARAKVETAGEMGVRLREDRPERNGENKPRTVWQHQGGPSGEEAPEDQQPATEHHRANDQQKVHERNVAEQNGDDLRASELRNAELVARQHRDIIRFNVNRGKWMFWTGSHWNVDDAGYVQNCIKAEARRTRRRLIDAGADPTSAARTAVRMESAAGIAGVEKLLRSEPALPVGADALDRDAFALNVLNGTIDLRTGNLRPHNRDNLITRVLPFNFDPGAQAPRWEQFIREITGGDAELAKYLQRLAGLYASADISVQEFHVFYGVGANGKNVFVETLLYIFCEYAGVAPDSLLMVRRNQEHPTELASLLGKRLVVASETEEGGTLRLQLVKKLTGDEWITGRFMRQDFFTFRRTHKLILVTNNKPKVPENTEAAWRRLRLVPFDVVIPPKERDQHLLEKLKTEVQGILAWIVRGSVERVANGMQPPERVTAATSAYRDESDPLADYSADRLAFGEDLRVVRGDLWTDYESWAFQSGEKGALTREQFYARVRTLEGVRDAEWKLAGKKVRGFIGVGLGSVDQPEI